MSFSVISFYKNNVAILFIIFIIQCVIQCNQANEVRFSTNEITLLVDQAQLFDVISTGNYNSSYLLTFVEQHDGLVEISPPIVNILPNNSIAKSICMQGKSPGHLDVTANITPAGVFPTSQLFIRVTIQNSNFLYHFSQVIGWIYFVAWSVSFYPQIYINFKRKSVVGLNFDFISLNIVGFLLYSLFNLGLFYIPEVQEEYFNRYPRGLNPIQVNDIFFSLHASFATLVTIVQCFIYERDNQTISITARVIHAVFVTFLLISCILAASSVLTWLDFLYYCSYVKLTITLIKYVPQAYMNYKRKSTVGWSIGNIFLDFVGGTLSMLQMILNAYNYNDWASIFGDVTKFGLGLFSVVFDIFFIVQHYVLYRNNAAYTEISGDNILPDILTDE